MWEEMENNVLVKSYFPDYPPSKIPNAEYFYKVKYNKYLSLLGSKYTIP